MKAKELFGAVGTKVSKTFNIAVAKTKQHSPEILIISGIIGVVASAVMACKATTKINDILEETCKDLDTVHSAQQNKELSEKYTLEDSRKDTAIIYIRTGVKFIKLYGPSVILGALSITSILASNNILKKRNMALATAYAAIDKGFKEYRNRVVERFGSEVDNELRYNIQAKKFEDTVTDEDGKEKKVKKTVNVVDPTSLSDFAKFFDEFSKAFDRDSSEMNLVFLKQQQNYFNDKLRTRGYVYLNEVLEALDIPTSKIGHDFGWLYRPNDPSYHGDNYIDFRIYNGNRESSRAFVNGYEKAILLDFNVDGYIADKLYKIG